jgi:two-component system, OmpR family, KDP operon response regulator KdpE
MTQCFNEKMFQSIIVDDKQKILVIDDETQIIRVMRQILAAHQYQIRTAHEGEAGLELFNDWKPDLVITDLQMPEVDGLEFCRRVRKYSDVPIIVLSVKDDEKTIVEALDAGADDYVTKPFATNVLLARVRANLRRIPEKSDNIIEIGDFYIDFSGYKVLVNNKEIHLTPKEFELLAFLLKHPDKVLTHQVLLQKIWGSYYSESPEALRVLVGTLRKKIEKDFSKPQYILTEPWIGYRFITSK